MVLVIFLGFNLISTKGNGLVFTMASTSDKTVWSCELVNDNLPIFFPRYIFVCTKRLLAMHSHKISRTFFVTLNCGTLSDIISFGFSRIVTNLLDNSNPWEKQFYHFFYKFKVLCSHSNAGEYVYQDLLFLFRLMYNDSNYSKLVCPNVVDCFWPWCYGFHLVWATLINSTCYGFIQHFLSFCFSLAKQNLFSIWATVWDGPLKSKRPESC